MGVAKILFTQEYTHAYCFWKSIAAYNSTWVWFKSHFMTPTWTEKTLRRRLERQDIEVSTTSSTVRWKMPSRILRQLHQQEIQRSLSWQRKMVTCPHSWSNKKTKFERCKPNYATWRSRQQPKTLREKPTKQRHHMYETRGKNHSGQQIWGKRNTTIRITVGHMDTTTVTHTWPKHVWGQTRYTCRRQSKETKWGISN